LAFLAIRFDSKIIGIESGFESIPNVRIVGSGRFQKLEPKPDPTVSLDSISNIGIENRLESSRINFKKVEIDLSFDSISNVEIVKSS